MKEDETLVYRYLSSIGRGEVTYEPDGNIPPDFLVDGSIAVEARRLNLNVVSDSGKFEGREQAFISFAQRFERFIEGIGPRNPAESWYVGFNIERPLEPWNYIEPKLRSILEAFMGNPGDCRVRVKVTKNLSISFIKAGSRRLSTFRLGLMTDGDSGGFLVGDVYENLKLCIAEKELKTAHHRHRYPEWWLVMPDHIGYALDLEDRMQLKKLPRIEHSWDKVVLINPLRPESGFEV